MARFKTPSKREQEKKNIAEHPPQRQPEMWLLRKIALHAGPSHTPQHWAPPIPNTLL